MGPRQPGGVVAGVSLAGLLYVLYAVSPSDPVIRLTDWLTYLTDRPLPPCVPIRASCSRFELFFSFRITVPLILSPPLPFSLHFPSPTTHIILFLCREAWNHCRKPFNLLDIPFSLHILASFIIR